jgi:hypothetical protein
MLIIIVRTCLNQEKACNICPFQRFQYFPKASPLSYSTQKTSLNLAPNWYPIIFTGWKDPLKFIFLCEFKLNTLLYLYKKDKFTKCLLQGRLVLTKNVQENIYTVNLNY